MLALAACEAPPWTASSGVNAPRHRDAPIVLLLSFDAFPAAFLDRGLTPRFEALAARGARADGLIPVFPTKTYPNHFSIATGLYPGRHGIVSNGFYDPAFRATYRLGDRNSVEDGRWYDGEPIWVTAETQGMVAAAMFFVGTEAPVRGIMPTYWHVYEHELPAETRIRTMLDWLEMPPETRPHLITGYFSVVDDSTHRYGIDAPATAAAVVEADRLLGLILEGIARLQHAADVHVVIVSDHGMTATGAGETILDEWTDLGAVRVMAAGTLAHIWVHDTVTAQAGPDTAAVRIAAELDRAPHLSAFVRERIPAEWHVADNPRIGDVLVVAEEGTLLRRAAARPSAERATHGYAPTPVMDGIFLAAGSRIREGVRVPRFENVHIYPLLAEVLGLRPAAGIDGRLEVLRPILRGRR